MYVNLCKSIFYKHRYVSPLPTQMGLQFLSELGKLRPMDMSSVLVHKVLLEQPHTFMYCLYVLSRYNGGVEHWFQQRTHGLKTWKYVPSGPLQNKTLADPWCTLPLSDNSISCSSCESSSREIDTDLNHSFEYLHIRVHCGCAIGF